ncbi:protein arginine kinase [Gorillibacterium timonense]|uniref:protein arginine kinase n=1 Tax=Gorillibacterium timonense TaxID=1689269 RepID=UPI00071CC583|nr:protein arginine kinase [Gorillibacterium timonense]
MVVGHFTDHALSDWMKQEGPESDIVLSSRIRLARNMRGYPFPMLATNQQSRDVLDKVTEVLENEELRELGDFTIIPLSDISELEKKVLVEKHLISPSLANESRGGAVILSQNESISIMVNEEDHLRIQCLTPGFQIREAWDMANRIDDIIESQLNYAFDERRGYLTSCPTNVGTGLRASVMIHLPALVMTQQINRILSAVTQVGLVVRGMYGEGSDSSGNLFQISNQITLGQSEEEILNNLYGVVQQIIEHERAARERLQEDTPHRLADRINRSFGILSHAVILDSKEAMQRLSDVRLGIDLGLLGGIEPKTLNELLVMTQPGFLQKHSGELLTAENRDIRRAELIRERVQE